MSDFIPVNDLDRAIMALQKSKAAWPDFYRAVIEGELWFPVHYHPEVVEGGKIQIQNGSPVPFPVRKDKQGHLYTLLFSSEERYDESCKKCNVPERTYVAGAMPAKQILEILGKMELHAQINLQCATGSVMIPPDMMRDLASGEVLKPLGLHGEETVQRHMRIIPPEEFPTDLIQPAFEFLRERPQFRAVFLLTMWPEVKSDNGRRTYSFGIIMEPEDEVLFHDLNMVLAAACVDKYEFELSVIAPKDIATYFQAGTPFYRATDYQPPSD